MKERNSRLELLKIIGMIFIVTYHVEATLFDVSPEGSISNIQRILLVWIGNMADWGNDIFFMSSAWFLLGAKNVNTKKILRILADTLFLCCLTLGFVCLLSKHFLPRNEMLISIFQLRYGFLWYVKYYALFCLVYPLLNVFIEHCSRKQLFTVNLVTIVYFSGIDFFISERMTLSPLLRFVIIYLAVAYMKKYGEAFSENRKLNGVLMTISIVGMPIIMMIMSHFGKDYTHWRGMSSPFVFLASITAMNLVLSKQWKNRFVNELSGLLLLIYILHENYVTAFHIRPFVWEWILERTGYSYVILWDILFGLCLFVVSVIISFLYKISLQKLIYKISDLLNTLFMKVYEFLLEKVFKIK